MIVLERAPRGSLHDRLGQLHDPSVFRHVFKAMAECVQQIHSRQVSLLIWSVSDSIVCSFAVGVGRSETGALPRVQRTAAYC